MARSASRWRSRRDASWPTSRRGARPRCLSKDSLFTESERKKMPLDFYHGHGSPFSWRVWLALEHKAVPYNLKVLSFQDNDTTKPGFVALNPRHTVPTIVDDGYSLWESMAILEYLDERFAAGAKLYPGDAKARARVRRLMREAEEYMGGEAIDLITGELFFKEGGASPDMDRVAKGRTRLGEEL